LMSCSKISFFPLATTKEEGLYCRGSHSDIY
jgi:hypothetical protein